MSDNSQISKRPKPPTTKEIEEQLLERNPHIFDGLSNTKKKQLLNSFKDVARIEIQESFIQSQFFSGPLPDPNTLKAYSEINPNLAIEIVEMAKTEQNYIQKRDDKIIEKSFQLKSRGQAFALTIALTAIIGGVICILYGQPIAGSIVSGVGLVGLVSQFLGGSSSDSKDDNKVVKVDESAGTQ